MTQPFDHDRLHLLAERFRSGDQEAFRHLHAQINPGLVAYLQVRCPSTVDLEALVQEVWVKAWVNRERYDNSHFRGWVFQIAKNRLIDHYRRGGRTPRFEEWGEREVATQILAEQSDQSAALADCLQTVGGEFVAVLRLRIEGLPTDEIAARMSITPAAVFSRASRGRDALRQCIEQKLK